MKPFNLEEAKAGKPVCTRDGHSVRIICFDAKRGNYPIIALVENKGEEVVVSYNLDGRYCNDNNDELDLFMAPEKHEGYGWLSRNDIYSMFATIYKTKEKALSHKPDRGEPFLAKVEWEE